MTTMAELAQRPEMQRLENAVNELTAAFKELPPDLTEALIAQEPMIGTLFMVFGIPLPS